MEVEINIPTWIADNAFYVCSDLTDEKTCANVPILVMDEDIIMDMRNIELWIWFGIRKTYIGYVRVAKPFTMILCIEALQATVQLYFLPFYWTLGISMHYLTLELV